MQHYVSKIEVANISVMYEESFYLMHCREKLWRKRKTAIINLKLKYIENFFISKILFTKKQNIIRIIKSVKKVLLLFIEALSS